MNTVEPTINQKKSLQEMIHLIPEESTSEQRLSERQKKLLLLKEEISQGKYEFPIDALSKILAEELI